MLRAAIVLALVASALASPLFDLDDIKPEPGCHYNISAMPHFHTPTGPFEVYVDSVTSSTPLNTWTCSKWAGRFDAVHNNVGKISFQWKIRSAHGTTLINCTGSNFADQPADFLTHCFIVGANFKFTMQIRVADVGNTFVFQTMCAAKDTSGQWNELMVFLSTSKGGLKPDVRSMLIKRLVKAGWDRKLIQRVPTQNGC